MVAAIIGLIGVVLGGAVTQVGAFFNGRRQVRSEAEAWRRDQRTAAYDGALRYLLRFSNRRSSISARGSAFLAQEHVREMFDDLVEAQFWLHALASRCGAKQAERIVTAASLLDEDVAVLTGVSTPGRVSGAKGLQALVSDAGAVSLFKNATAIVKTITECAREDQGTLKRAPG